MITFDSFLKAIPAVTLVAFALAVAYVFGDFSYVGLDWMSSLTPSDLLALSWRALPLSLITMGTGYFFGALFPRPRTIPETLASQKFKRGLLHAVLVGIYRSYFILTAIGFPLIIAMIPSIRPPEYAILVTPLAGLSILSLIKCFEIFASEERFQSSKSLAGCIGILIFSFAAGVSSGGIKALSDRDLVASKAASPHCVSIFYAGERGVIFREAARKSSGLIPWPEVTQIQRDVCPSVVIQPPHAAGTARR